MSCSKILIVDDADFAHNIYKVLFGSMKLSILTAKSGREALSILVKENGIDLVVMDLNMPSMNGLEFLKQCPPRLKDETPIVMVSSDMDEAKKQSALNLGAVRYFEKAKIKDLKEFASDLMGC